MSTIADSQLRKISFRHRRQWRRISQLAVIECFALVTLTVAVEPPAAPEEATRTQVRYDKIIPASQLFGRSLFQGSSKAAASESTYGIIQDLLIDPSSGDVPLAVVERSGPVRSHSLLPITAGQIHIGQESSRGWGISADEMKALDQTVCASLKLPASADQVHACLLSFKIKPSWGDKVAETQPIEFVSLRSLIGQKIQTRTGEDVGVITEFVLDLTKSRIAYTLLTPGLPTSSASPSNLNQSPRLVIPLAAYEQTNQSQVWILDVPGTELAVEKRIPADSFPNEIPRAWIEYVSVRYGADVEKGLQGVDAGKKSR